MLDVLVYQGIVAHRPVLHMHRRKLPAHVLVHLFRNVRRHRRQHQSGRHDRVLQREVRSILVLRHIRILGPRSISDKAHIPSGEVLHDVILENPGELVKLPRLQILGGGLLHLLRPGDHPAVLVAQVRGDLAQRMRIRVVPVDDHVRGREVHHVPIRVENLPRILRPVLLERRVLPGRVALDQIVPQGIRTDLVDQLQRLDHIPEGLRHLLSLRIEHPSVHHHFVVRRTVEGDHSRSELRVEPSAGLVVRFHDESRRPPLLELVLPPRVPEVGPGSHTGIEPHVQHIRDPVHGLPALRTGERDLVDPRPVGVHSLGITGTLLELLVLPHDLPGAALALPYRHGDPPVPLPGDAPVPGALDPVLLPGGSRPIRHPLHAVYLREHLILHVRHGHEPLPRVPVDDRGLASPAVPVPVLDLADVEHQALLVQDLDHLVRDGLDLLADHRGELFGVPPGLGHGAERLDAVPLPRLVIVGTVSRRGVDQTGVVLFNIISKEHLPRPLALRRGLQLERRDVLQAFELLPRHAFDDLELLVAALLHDVLRLFLKDDHILRPLGAGHPHLRVPEVRVHGDGHVGRQGPRRGGPYQKRSAPVLQREPDHHGRVGLVPILDLRLGESGLAPGAPGDDPARGLQQPFLLGPLDGPPCRLQVIQLDRQVRVVPIHPHPELLELLGHVVVESQSELLAGGDELVYPELLDVLLGVDADLLLHLHLDREAVHVEPGLVADVVPAHPPVPDQDVLHGLVHRRAQVDGAGGVRRAVHEVEGLPVGAELLRLPVGVGLFPKSLDILLDALRIIIGADLLYHRIPSNPRGFSSPGAVSEDHRGIFDNVIAREGGWHLSPAADGRRDGCLFRNLVWVQSTGNIPGIAGGGSGRGPEARDPGLLRQ